MAITPCENAKGFAHSRPPIMVFMLCLGLFAIVLMTLAYYVKETELTNPDVTQDWNVFLGNFAELEFCVQGNTTDYLGTTISGPTTSKPAAVPTTTLQTHEIQAARDTTENVKLEADGLRNYSVSMLVTVLPTEEFTRMPFNLTYLSASIEARQIGFLGTTGDEMINVTVQLPLDWNASRCSPDKGCGPLMVLACVHFVAAAKVFPPTRSPVCESNNDTGTELHAFMLPRSDSYSPYYCRQRPVVKVQHKLDPTLTVWLSLNDRSVINLHLMHTSYFLFVMVVTLMLYAIIRGGYNSGKMSQAHLESQVPLTEA